MPVLPPRARSRPSASPQAGTDTVALGGGVFANMLLLDGIMLQLQAAGMRVLTAERFPANDGGLALGQAAVASACASEP